MSWTTVNLPGTPPPNASEETTLVARIEKNFSVMSSAKLVRYIGDYVGNPLGTDEHYYVIPPLSAFNLSPFGEQVGPSILPNTVVNVRPDCSNSGCTGGGSTRPLTGVLYPRGQG